MKITEKIENSICYTSWQVEKSEEIFLPLLFTKERGKFFKPTLVYDCPNMTTYFGLN